jgi:hypothetical protein
MLKCLLVFSLILLFNIGILQNSRAQSQRDSATAISVAEASLIPASAIGAIFVLNYDAFWRYATEVPFHISNDPPYAMHIDKFAHTYVSATGSDAIRAAYRLAGVSEETSAWLGAGLTFVAGVAVEMEDARHGDDPEYGFSPGDAAGDLIGSSLPLLRYYYPVLRRLDIKMGLWPSEAYKSGTYKFITDDYESQYFWLSFDLHEITPLPSWLNLAVGFSAENLLRQQYHVPSPDGPPYTDIYFGPDINLKGIPIPGAWWQTLSAILSYIRIPFPALQCYPRMKFWWLR